MDMFIGLSLSFCVKDILAGKVSIDAVKAIISGTLIQSEKELQGLLSAYSETYWRDFSDEAAEEIVRKLIISGKFIQPRVFNIKPPNIHKGYWVSATRNLDIFLTGGIHILFNELTDRAVHL
jgi:(2Fe-2S) ferredoxin